MRFNDHYTTSDAAHDRLCADLESEYLPDAGLTLAEAIEEAVDEHPRHSPDVIVAAMESMAERHPLAFREPKG